MDGIISHVDFLILSESEDLFPDPESDLLLTTLTKLKGQYYYDLLKGKLIYLLSILLRLKHIERRYFDLVFNL